VRIGDAADYGSTYNPDLWLRPWPTFGTLAGRVTDREGNPVHDVTITLGSDGGPDRYASSYADDTVNSDLYYGENYTRGDLPEGEYRVFVRMRGVLRYQGMVHIEAGRTNWLDIVLN
ncbi:MAG: carboxypeptidase regulatory-like domain-containing protein, partial [Anaerolineae bacterium]|nr:carboxypeptidase regulatory-like domain-containing protein [Anaerolineae bacterium]